MELSELVKELRFTWAKGDAIRDAGLTTPDDIKRFDNLSYGPYGDDNLLDIYVKKDVTNKQPAIVNIHGGGWVYGNKEVYQFYCMGLAQRGFTVVNINYRLAPENKFPCAVEDINRVMEFIAAQGEKYYVDRDRLILVGDSAGGQLVSHYAAIVTNKEFAKLFDFSVPDITIKALGLNCGAYDSKNMILSTDDDAFNEYVGTITNPAVSDIVEKIDTIGHMTSAFPPSFVMSTVVDFLLPEAEPMYEKLKSLGVPAKLEIYGSSDRPDIGHVFHVNSRMPEARECNDDECEFFRKFV
ncbi:MAG: alpha/beta hydrolase [Clostridiales bacterium]|nr:alpha/beta hydrolase [Clostridiales bacterium]